MTEDWMTDAHKAAALEGWLSNPVAQLHAQQQAPEAAADNPMGLALAAWQQASTGQRMWTGAANGRSTTFVTAAPEDGGLDAVYVRPVLTEVAQGVELVDADGNVLGCDYFAPPGAPTRAESPTEPEMVAWLRAQVAEDRQMADAVGFGDWWLDSADDEATTAVQRFANRDNILAQCDAYERVLARHRHPNADDEGWMSSGSCAGCGVYGDTDLAVTDDLAECPELRDMARAFRHRPGFREEWLG